MLVGIDNEAIEPAADPGANGFDAIFLQLLDQSILLLIIYVRNAQGVHSNDHVVCPFSLRCDGNPQNADNDIDPTRLDRACARLGDAVIDPAMWPEILEQISAAVGAIGAVLVQSDARTRDIPRSAGINEMINAYFGNGWHTRDLRADRGFTLIQKGEMVVTDQDIVTPDEMQRSFYYNELVAPYGLRWFAGVPIWAGPALWVSIQRTPRQGSFEANDKRVLAHLSQPLTEIATLSTAVGRIALSSATNALNAVRQPAVAIDRLGFVLDANAGAEELFDQDIRIVNRRLVVHDAQAQSNLEKLANRLRVTPDTTTLPCEPIVIPRRDKSPVILRVLPVHGAARAPFLGARALLTLTAVEPRPGPKPALLAKAFGLTPAEARLASIIAEGLNPERAAEELGISKVTARNQLKAIFAKTGTHRQSELVARFSRF
jgi:DNA-binding CsgD family transcriptional regulator/PAS domain-containing protein